MIIHRWTMLILCICCCRTDRIVADERDVLKYSRQADVIYGRKHGLALTMEVLEPPVANGLGVIWIVSSSGVSSREKTFQPSFEQRIRPFLNQGYKVFAVIHGSSPRFQLRDYFQDGTRAVRFVRFHSDQFEIDPDRLAIAGSSAGGHIALMIATQGRDGDEKAIDPVERVSSKVRAAGCFFPPTDLLNYAQEHENVLDFMRRKYGMVPPAFEFFDVDAQSGARTPIRGREDLLLALREMSPIMHVSPDDPPTILIHGDSDSIVPVQQSKRFVGQLEKAQVAVRLVLRKGKTHAWKGWEADSELIAAWFNRQLIDNP